MFDLFLCFVFWLYLLGYVLLLFLVLFCVSGSYCFVILMVFVDGVDLVYFSQGLVLLLLGIGLVGLFVGFFLYVCGCWFGVLLVLLLVVLICVWNLYNYVVYGDEVLLLSFVQYIQVLFGLLLFGGVLSLVDLFYGRFLMLLCKGLLGLGWLVLVVWLGLLFYLQCLYGFIF